jgi:hypothetical protein
MDIHMSSLKRGFNHSLYNHGTILVVLRSEHALPRPTIAILLIVLLAQQGGVGVEMMFVLEEKETKNVYTRTLPSEHLFFVQQQQPTRNSSNSFFLVMVLLTTTATCCILYGLLPIVLWIVSLIVQTIQRQGEQALLALQEQQGSSTSSTSSSSSSSSLPQHHHGCNMILFAQRAYQLACYWTYHVVPRLTASLLTLYMCSCLAYVGWLKVASSSKLGTNSTTRRTATKRTTSTRTRRKKCGDDYNINRSIIINHIREGGGGGGGKIHLLSP